ncbi:MAG: RNA-binding protein, partial [Nitrospirae bacterium]|nr:RNA-binding protein [Nitrospirota bacterium]
IMGKRLYVGNIPFKATEETLKELFSQAGEVESVKLVTDPSTGQSKGFGFVEMTSEEDAKKAITSLNGSMYMERTLSVDEARPPRQDRGGFGGRGRGPGGPGRGRR